MDEEPLQAERSKNDAPAWQQCACALAHASFILHAHASSHLQLYQGLTR